jgi:phosphoribosylanthranilate isomerase
MWIKVCGNTSLEDAELAIEAGADAVGFIFAGGPRQMTPERVGIIVAQLPGSVETYGVFGNLDFDAITAIAEESGLSGIQLHGGADVKATIELAGRLRAHFAKRFEVTGRLGRMRIHHVLHYHDGIKTELAELSATRDIDAALVDNRTATLLGGTGLSFDWQGARKSFLSAAPKLRLIAAGGLNPENVAEAIFTLQPWGVDVASGVEASVGKKDPAKVREFVARARRAVIQVNEASGKVH